MNVRTLIFVTLFAGLPASCGMAAEPHVAGTVQPSKSEVDRGRYLVRVAGCQDCHTPGYAAGGGHSDDDSALTGAATAYEGPWGTTFATNLRLTMLRFNDAEWLRYTRSLATRPPMPWFNMRSMNDEDLLAIQRYVQWLGPKGEPAPQALPPGEEWIGAAVKFTAAAPQ